MLGFLLLSLCAFGCVFVGLIGTALWDELFHQPLASGSVSSPSSMATTAGVPPSTRPLPPPTVHSPPSVIARPTQDVDHDDLSSDRVWGAEAARLDARSRRYSV